MYDSMNFRIKRFQDQKVETMQNKKKQKTRVAVTDTCLELEKTN